MVRVIKDLFPKPDPDEDGPRQNILLFLCGVVLAAVIMVPVLYWAQHRTVKQPAAPADIALPGSAGEP